jgi:hypothetical protein
VWIGFGGDPDAAPALQLAFAYTCLEEREVPCDDKSEERDEVCACCCSLYTSSHSLSMQVWLVAVRRLRVLSVVRQVAALPSALHDRADASAIAAVLTHKVIRASLKSGLREAALLVQVRVSCDVVSRDVVSRNASFFRTGW